MVTTNRRATLSAILEGTQIINENNFTTTRKKTSFVPCEEYSIPDSLTVCKPGYNKIQKVLTVGNPAGTEYRIRKRRRVFSYRRGTSIRIYSSTRITHTAWTSVRPIVPVTVTERRAENDYALETRTVAAVPPTYSYTCTPGLSCEGEPIFTTVLTNSGNITASHNTIVTRTPDEIQVEADRLQSIQDTLIENQRLRDVETQRLQNIENQRLQDIEDQRLRDVETQRIQGIEDDRVRKVEADRVERVRLARIESERIQRSREVEAQQASASRTSGQYTGDTARENSQDTKYKIISPPGIRNVRGRAVPTIQYESVRYLSPGAVASYVARGYVLESVDPRTPTSTSKPYGKSVIANAQSLNLKTFVPNNERRKRLTFSDFSKISKATVRKASGTFRTRHHTRTIS